MKTTKISLNLKPTSATKTTPSTTSTSTSSKSVAFPGGRAHPNRSISRTIITLYRASISSHCPLTRPTQLPEDSQPSNPWLPIPCTKTHQKYLPVRQQLLRQNPPGASPTPRCSITLKRLNCTCWVMILPHSQRPSRTLCAASALKPKSNRKISVLAPPSSALAFAQRANRK